LILLFDFMAPGKAPLSTQRYSVEEPVLEPGAEASFKVQLVDPVRAVQYRLKATDRLARDLRVANAGPFAIE
jgi:hypothetical protein